MVLPEVVGYRITGRMSQLATSTDVVLTITKHLRQVCSLRTLFHFVLLDSIEENYIAAVSLSVLA